MTHKQTIQNAKLTTRVKILKNLIYMEVYMELLLF